MAAPKLAKNKVSAKQLIGSRRDYSTICVIRENNAKQIANAINAALVAALEEIGLAAEGFAKKNLTRNKSVDTGRLRNSVTHVIDVIDESVYIGTNVEYAPYVELGTSRSKKKPFLKPAASNHTSEYRKILENHLKNA